MQDLHLSLSLLGLLPFAQLESPLKSIMPKSANEQKRSFNIPFQLSTSESIVYCQVLYKQQSHCGNTSQKLSNRKTQ